MVLVDPPHGTAKKWHFHAVAAAAPGNQEYKNHLDMGHKIRKAMADRDASYQLAGCWKWMMLFSDPPNLANGAGVLSEKQRSWWQLKLPGSAPLPKTASRRSECQELVSHLKTV